MRFTALQDFYSEETGSHYLRGLSYTVRPGNAQLSDLVDKWAMENKVRISGLAATLQGKD